MLDKIKLQKLKKAVKSMETVNDTFFIDGEIFSCRWNGFVFDWCILGRIYKNCTKKEILSWIDDGSNIINYCYSYGDDVEA